MWDLNDPIMLIFLTYAVLGVTAAIFLSIRRRKSGGSRSGHGKRQAPTSTGDSTYIVNRRYEVKLPPHRQGGMATIWLAAERKTGKACIIKTPRRGTTMDNVYLDKLMLEASYLKRLNHPGIVNTLTISIITANFTLSLSTLTGKL